MASWRSGTTWRYPSQCLRGKRRSSRRAGGLNCSATSVRRMGLEAVANCRVRTMQQSTYRIRSKEWSTRIRKRRRESSTGNTQSISRLQSHQIVHLRMIRSCKRRATSWPGCHKPGASLRATSLPAASHQHKGTGTKSVPPPIRIPSAWSNRTLNAPDRTLQFQPA